MGAGSGACAGVGTDFDSVGDCMGGPFSCASPRGVDAPPGAFLRVPPSYDGGAPVASATVLVMAMFHRPARSRAIPRAISALWLPIGPAAGRGRGPLRGPLRGRGREGRQVERAA